MESLNAPGPSAASAPTISRDGADVASRNLRSSYGHDAFLLEEARQTSLIRPFLRRLREEAG